MSRLVEGKTPGDVLLYLKGVEFPALKDAVVRAARHNGAPTDVVAALENLPRTSLDSAQQVIDLYPRLD